MTLECFAIEGLLYIHIIDKPWDYNIQRVQKKVMKVTCRNPGFIIN